MEGGDAGSVAGLQAGWMLVKGLQAVIGKPNREEDARAHSSRQPIKARAAVPEAAFDDTSCTITHHEALPDQVSVYLAEHFPPRDR